MRVLAFSSIGIMLFLGGCVLAGTYNYDDYKDKLPGTGGNDSVSSSTGGGGVAGAGGMGGGTAGMGGSAGMSGMGGGVQCSPEVCNNGKDDDCKNDGDCSVLASVDMRLGDVNHQSIAALSVQESDHSIAIAGIYAGNLAFTGQPALINGTTTAHPFVAHLDTDGNALKVFEVNAEGIATGVTAQGIDIFAGIVKLNSPSPNVKTIVLQKFDSMGMGWTHELGSNLQNGAPKLASSATGPIFAACSLKGNITPPSCPGIADYNTTQSDSLLMELSPGTGSCSWATRISNSRVLSVSARSDAVVIGGYYSGTIGLSPNTNTLDTAAYIVAYGTTNHEMKGYNLFATTNAGVVSFTSVTAAANGMFYATGTLQGTLQLPSGKTLTSVGVDADIDTIVAKFDASMQLLWMERFGAVGAQLPYAIAEQGGNVYVSGTTSAQMATVPDSDSGLLCNASKCMFLLKLNASSGATIWGRAFGPGEMAMDPTSLIAADTTSLWLGGGWSSLIDFNMGSKSALGAQDLVLAKFAPLP